MPPRSTLSIHDRALDGQLKPLLVRWSAEGLTLEDMAFRLRTDHEVRAAVSTIGRWVHEAKAEVA